MRIKTVGNADAAPFESVTVRSTSNSPKLRNVCVGFRAVEVEPSPKVH